MTSAMPGVRVGHGSSPSAALKNRPALPLHDPGQSSDACGVGFVFDRSMQTTHRTLARAIECLHNLDHRGAHAADGTGDGAGIMTRLPYRLLARALGSRGLEVPARGRLGVMAVLLPSEGAEACRSAIEASARREGLRPVAWREVPVDASALGALARATMPLFEQLLVEDGRGDEDDFERSLLLARKGAEQAVEQEGIEGFSVASASCRTVVYKGLFTAKRVALFYEDLRDPVYETDFAIFHQRYSTNTVPTWDRAQPFRILAHNGEINTVRSNRAWMAARQVDLEAAVWGARVADLRPLLKAGDSDSGSLDHAFELLVRSGRSLDHVKEMLIPPAWENVSGLDPRLAGFYEYHAFLTEPWDGPAAIAASDGVTLLAGMDRNGLRPARWTITPDVVVVASEAGILPDEESHAEETGQLGPGESLVVDLRTGELRIGKDVKSSLARRLPYRDWVRTEAVYVADPFDDLQDERFEPERLARVFGYTPEERRLVLAPMTEGIEPLGSMGHDTPIAALATGPQRMTRYFHQMFAQVTNPAMDPIRERQVMSLRVYLGRRGSILSETRQQAHLMELASPVLSDAELEEIVGHPDQAFRSRWLTMLFPAAGGDRAFIDALDDLCRRAEEAVREGATILVLSDREVGRDLAPLPAVLAVGAVHHHLIRSGLRLHASIVVVSGEPRDAHDLACLIGFGASAVNPYLAIEQVRAMAASGAVEIDPVTAQENYRLSLGNGLLKVMSKMGICTVSAYRGSELFESLGLDEDVTERAFRFVARRLGGVSYERLAAQALAAHALYTEGHEHPGGFYKHRRGGVPHANTPKAVLAVQRAVRSGEWDAWQSYLQELRAGRRPKFLRDLLEITGDRPPIPLDEVEAAERIMRRFTTSAMSLGALSKEAHEALAEAMSLIGGLSNSGEGGEDPARFGTPRNSEIKQVASGRFGVTPAYLASAEEYQIKMAQGSKPGEGGQLPGHKVSSEIARLRHTEPGVTLISPPPHHDIYSIEDLAQLVYDLKTFKPRARVSVKLVSEPGVGTVAVGVAKARADVVTISGHEGGTGASPLISIKHAGSPWELGVAEAHQALVSNGLRERITVETDGGLRTGRDVVIAALLGAERFGFGTLPLLALGCKMVRQCHENTCPVGIATQREDLRAKFKGGPEQVVQLFAFVAEEVRGYLASLGARSLQELVGRADLLRPAEAGHRLSEELAALLARAETPRRTTRYQPIERSPLGDAITDRGTRAIVAGRSVEDSYEIVNTDRAIGTRLAGEIAQKGWDIESDTLRVRLSGVAGQSLGAFLTEGISILLEGAANDYVGKGMGGGLIVVVPRVQGSGQAQGSGNAVLYGATGGRLHVAGLVGQRFAVRNSGARAVVEGAGDHACEYMTGGEVVILGGVGNNAAAGMTGGVLYLWDPDGVAPRYLADTAPQARRPEAGDVARFLQAVEEHLRLTESLQAKHVLEAANHAGSLWLVRPRTPEPADRLELGVVAVETTSP